MAVRLIWNSELESFKIPDSWIELLERLLKEAAEHEQLSDGEVSLTFVDDETIRELNREYRQIDRPTDVLSFALRDEMEEEGEIRYEEDVPELLGDIIISVPTAIRQSEEYGHSLEREIAFLFVHGFLHLLGYDHGDETSEREMFSLQEQLLQKVGVTR
jgi:probable rRNA maturation factor